MVPAPPLMDRVILGRSWNPTEPRFSYPSMESCPQRYFGENRDAPAGASSGLMWRESVSVDHKAAFKLVTNTSWTPLVCLFPVESPPILWI